MGQPPADRPTRARFIVLAFICSLSFVLYLDRVCISQAAVPIQDELGITATEWGYVLMAFTLAYGLCEIPTGRWGDRYGPRRVLTRIVLWWSAFTALTAACWNLPSLLVVRFLFGAGEAGAYPNVARVIRRWFPAAERERTQTLFLTAALIGGGLAPAVAGLLIKYLGWEAVFLVFGAVGAAWAVLFVRWFRDDPATHPGTNEAERKWIADGAAPAAEDPGPIPWAAALRHPPLLFLAAVMICAAFNGYLYTSRYPEYLERGRGLKNEMAGYLASGVLVASATGVVIGGALSSRVNRLAAGRPDRLRRMRRAVGAGAMLAAAGLLVLAIRADDAYVSAALAALSCIAAYSQQPLWWSTIVGVSGRHTGTFFGFANGAGVFGAMASQFFFGWYADLWGRLGYTGREQWDPALWVYVGVLAVGAGCWALVDPTKPIPGSESHSESAPASNASDGGAADGTS